jgi:hypothetical protein
MEQNKVSDQLTRVYMPQRGMKFAFPSVKIELMDRKPDRREKEISAWFFVANLCDCIRLFHGEMRENLPDLLCHILVLRLSLIINSVSTEPEQGM